MTLLQIILVLLYAFFESMKDAYAILSHTYSKNQKQSHGYGLCSRALVISIIAVSGIENTYQKLTVIIFLGLIWWLAFEAILNWKRGLSLFYVGENASTDKTIRRVAEKFNVTPEKLNIVLKVCVLAMVITLATL